MISKRPKRWRLAAMVTMAGLVAAGCGSSSHSTANGGTSGGSGSGSTGATIPPPPKVAGTITGPGVTATTITIGQITTTSGPVPGLFQGANDGLDAWVAYMNSIGGIDGHTIKIDRVDDGFSCTTYTNGMKAMATSTFAVIGSFTLEDTCGKSVLAQYPNLIDIQGAALDPTLYSIPNMFTPAPDPPGYQTTGYAYFKSKFPKDITKVGQIGGEAAAANAKEQELTAQSLGYKYIYVALVPDLATQFTSNILRMKSDGVKIVDLGALGVPEVSDFLEQAAQQNFHPDAVISAAGYDNQLLKLIGNAADANNIMFAPIPFAMYLGTDRATVPAVNTLLNWLNTAHPGASANIYTVSAWASGTLLNQAMSAVGTGSGSTVTQAAVLQALAGINTFTSGGLLAPTNPGAKLGSHCLVVAGVVDGQWKRIDPSSGFDCSGVYHNVPLSALK